MIMVTVLFARSDSVYKTMPGIDVWDKDRDARLWPGGNPVVAHPPCRAWARLRAQARPRDDEKALALFAVAQVQRFGGVLEHPAGSTLWQAANLPRLPTNRLKYARSEADKTAVGSAIGWTLPIEQHWWGHLARKHTWLYIVGLAPGSEPPIPYRLDLPPAVVASNSPGRKHLNNTADREATPPDFARWLVELASRCRV
jgi:hypothetical protein